MHYLPLLPVLLASFAAASPAAKDTVTIFSGPNFTGLHRYIPVDGTCVNLGPPFSTPGKGIRSVLFSAPDETCQIHRTSDCQDPDPVVIPPFSGHITAHSIRCTKDSGDDD